MNLNEIFEKIELKLKESQAVNNVTPELIFVPDATYHFICNERGYLYSWYTKFLDQVNLGAIDYHGIPLQPVRRLEKYKNKSHIIVEC